MPLTRDQKTSQVKEMTDKMKNSSSVIFAQYIGLTVAEVSDLRNKLRETNAEMKVAKKTLAKIAAKNAGLPEIPDEVLTGAISFIMSYEDPLCGAQTAFKFSKDHKQVAIVGGIFDGKILSKEEAMALAEMPSRDILLATFMGMIQSPLRSFASMCQSPLSGFARIVSEAAEKGILGEEAPKKEAKESNEAKETEEAPSEQTEEAPAKEKTESESNAPESESEDKSEA